VTIRQEQSLSPHAWTLAELGTFYTEHRKSLHSHVHRLLRDSSRSEEVTHEAFIRLMLAAPELNNSSQALAYLHKTIDNLCIDIYRREGRRPNLVVLDEALAEIDELHRDSEDLSEALVSADDAAIVRQAISLLSAAERTALVMWEIEGRSSEEIASTLGIKKSAVRHTISRARSSLRRVLSELIINEEKGLTAIDLLSITYRKTAKVAKKSTSVALSLILFVLGYVGFSLFKETTTQVIVNQESKNSTIETFASVEPELITAESAIVSKLEISEAPKKKEAKVKSSDLQFPGLDKFGIPDGFTISDSKGNLGEALIIKRAAISANFEIVDGQIIKTRSNAANIFIAQLVSPDRGGASYSPTVSYGQSGEWIPLASRVTSTDLLRLKGGNYLLTAYIEVQSEVDSPIRVVASAGGRDLDGAPKQIVTRLLLDESRTLVLSQAVYVVEEDLSA